jgi:hypothetical protein
MTLKIFLLSISTCTLLLSGCNTKKVSEHEHATSTEQTVDTVKKSLPKEEHAMVGNAHLTIKYTAPLVRNRTIWGGLVAYDQVWVTGAHRATSFEIDKDFEVNGKMIPAGKYALFTIPGKEKWIFIINKKWDQHLADEYDVKDDITRVELKPEVMDTVQERLNFAVKADDDTYARIVFSWEKIQVALPIIIK